MLGEDGAFTEIPLEAFEGLIREGRIAAAGQVGSSESRVFQIFAGGKRGRPEGGESPL